MAVPPCPPLDDLLGPACVLAPRDGRVTHHNAAFAAWTGRADPTGSTLGDLFPGDAGIARLWEEADAAGPFVEHHLERRGADGAGTFWSVRARRTPGGVLVAAADVTAIATAAHALQASQHGFVAAAAHELRAPLSAIKAWASALSARRGGEEALRDDGLAAIVRQVDRMHLLLSDLLDAARSETGVLRAVLSAVPVPELIDRALASLPSAPSFETRRGAEDQVRVDPGHIVAAIARVAGWVASRQPDAPLVVSAERVGAEVHVLVADGGPPLSPVAEAQLFARTGAGRGRGLGLGLHVVQILAAASGARVFREASSPFEAPGPQAAPRPEPLSTFGAPGPQAALRPEPPPAGARFVVALPAADAPLPDRAPGPFRAAVVLPEDGGLRARAVTLLRLCGHLAEPASTLAEVDPRADLVFVDPLCAGFDLSGLRAALDPPVIIVAAPPGPRPDALVGVERAGAIAVLPRPIDWGHFLALVQTAAGARGC